MKAYLVLDFSVHDLGGFMRYVAEIPAFIAKHSGRYLVKGVQPTRACRWVHVTLSLPVVVAKIDMVADRVQFRRRVYRLDEFRQRAAG